MAMKYCVQCKKSLEISKFDKKNDNDYYSRCIICHEIHNKQERNKYEKRKCTAKKLCEFKNCEKCFNKSFASLQDLTPTENSTIKKVDCWDYEKNKDKPWEVFKSTDTKFWFKCNNCPHSFNSSLSSISNKKKTSWCPYCSNQKMCENNEDKHCITCYNKSFASLLDLTLTENSPIKKVDCWDYNKNKDKPWEVFKSTATKFWFKCDNCHHSFNSSLNNISNKKNAIWCPYCSNQKMCENNEDKHCITCYNKSFASLLDLTLTENSPIKKVDCWDYNKNKDKPWEVFKSTATKFWFKCDNCPHSFNTSLDLVSKNTWCPYCCIPSNSIIILIFCSFI